MYGWFLNVVLIFFFIYLTKRFFFVQNTVKGFSNFNSFNNRTKIYIYKEIKVSLIQPNLVKLSQIESYSNLKVQ